jgi:integral membrane protein
VARAALIPEEVGQVGTDALATAVKRYRFMAYLTGTVLIVLCFAGIPLQLAAHNDVIVNYVGTTHGILYLIYIGCAFVMTRRVGMKLGSPQTVLVLLAGTIPVLTFVVERWVTHRYIAPALAAQSSAPTGAPPGGQAGEPAGRQAPARPS